MTIQYQADMAVKNTQIHQMQAILDKFKGSPQVDEFIKRHLS